MTYARRVSIILLSFVLWTAPAAAQPATEIVTEGLVNAPADAVWKAWTTRDGIESWMVTKTEIDLRVGATWRTSYSAESTLDDEKAIHHVILAFDPGRMLSFRTVRPPQGFPWPLLIPDTWVVVYLEPSGSQTKVTVKMLGYTAGADSQQMRQFFERGNRITMDSLLARFATGATSGSSRAQR